MVRDIYIYIYIYRERERERESEREREREEYARKLGRNYHIKKEKYIQYKNNRYIFKRHLYTC